MGETHLVFLSKVSGYEVEEREGAPPALGAELDEDGTTMTVVKVGPSPFPGDRRACAYLMP